MYTGNIFTLIKILDKNADRASRTKLDLFPYEKMLKKINATKMAQLTTAV
jgi:hypothetical protein